MTEIDKVQLYEKLLKLRDRLGYVLHLSRENVNIVKDINRKLKISRLKIDAARAAFESRTLA